MLSKTGLHPAAGAKWVFVFISLVFVSACAQFPKQAFNREAYVSIKHIVLLEPAKPKNYTVAMAHHPGDSFGLIGAMIAVGDMESKSNDFSAAMRQREFDFAARLTDAVQAELERADFTVSRVAVERPNNGLLTDYSKVNAVADALIDWAIVWQGYGTATATTPYIPTAQIAIRMVDPKTQAVLYSELIGYGFQIGASQAVVLPANARFTYPNFQYLINSADAAIEGLEEGIPLISKQVGEDLRRS